MNSLKEKLKIAIRLRGYITTSELYEICRKEGYKLSNAERRLRELAHETNEIAFDRDAKGVIHGYKWQNLRLQQDFKPNLTGASEFVKKFLTTDWGKKEEVKQTANTLF